MIVLRIFDKGGVVSVVLTNITFLFIDQSYAPPSPLYFLGLDNGHDYKFLIRCRFSLE